MGTKEMVKSVPTGLSVSKVYDPHTVGSNTVQQTNAEKKSKFIDKKTDERG